MRFKLYLEVLKNWNFTKLWLSQLCSQLTNYVLSFAVLLQAFKLTESSLAVSLILVAFGLATVFFGGLAGVYADRFDRRKILTIVNFAQAFVVLFFIPFENSFAALAIITFLYSSLNQFYLPAEAPSIPNLVTKEHLLVANSFFSFTASSSMIFGFAIAGPLTLAFGSTAPFWIAFTLLSIAGLATATLPSLKPEPHPFQDYFVTNVWTEFTDGIKHLVDSKKIHFSFISLICAQIFNGMVITLTPAYVTDILKMNLEKGTLFMIAPMGIGILIGSLFLGIEGQYLQKKHMVRLGFAGLGVSTMLIALLINEQTRVFYPLLALLLGISNIHIFAPSHSLIQAFAGDKLRGRVYASLFLLLQLSATLPTVVVGVLAGFTPITVILGGLGVLLVGLSLVLGTSKELEDESTSGTPNLPSNDLSNELNNRSSTLNNTPNLINPGNPIAPAS